MSRLDTRILLCGFLVIGFTIGPSGLTGATIAGHADAQTASIGPTSQAQFAQAEADSADNDTVRHENPDEYRESGNPAQLQTWLMDRMVENIDESAVQLEDGNYDRAGRYVGDDYDAYLDQYLDVAAQTEDEDHAELFEAIREDQTRVTDAAQRYHELRDEYERARDAGDEARARELARELDSVATTATETGTQLRDQYDELEESTDANLSESERSIETVTEDIRSSQETIREEQFVATGLSVDADREEISFLEPLTGTGRLQTAEGEPVGNRPIELEIGNGSVRTETDADGVFEFEYRPVEEPLTTEELEIEYAPANESTYLGSATSVPVSISRTEPSVTDLETPDEVAYNDNATVSGTVVVDDVPVDNASLAVTLGGERIETTGTTNGSFDVDVTVPAGVPAGEREFGVRLEHEDRALAATPLTNQATVRETDSELSVTATRTAADGRTVDVNGTLETGDGEGVAGEAVRVDVDGTTVDTVSTDENGAFGLTATLPEGSEDVEVVATYDGSESNVASATARTTTGSTAVARLWGRLPMWARIGIGIGVLATLCAVVWWRRFRPADPADTAARERSESDDGAAPSIADRSRVEIARSLLEHGRECLADGRPEQAIEMGYAAVRHALSGRETASSALTHREFYRDWQRGRDAASVDGEDDAALLRIVIERYEQTTFGVADVSREEAEVVLESATRLCEMGSSPSTESTRAGGDA